MASFIQGKTVEIEHLGVDSNSALWMGQRMDEAIAAEVGRSGLSWGETNDTITTSPGAIVTAEALIAFKKASDGLTGPVEGYMTGKMAPWANDLCFGPPARLYRNVILGELSSASIQQIGFQVPSRTIAIKTADAPGGREIELSISDGVLMSTHHWSGLLWANLLCLAPVLWRHLIGSNLNLWWKVPLAWLKTRSLEPLLLAGTMNRKERNVFIHPSAVVEGCWLRQGARVGPGAVVRGCILGPNSVVESQALASFSVLAEGAVVQRRGWIQYGLIHAGGAVGGAMQMGVIGPKASFKNGSYLMDQSVGDEVCAMVNGRLRTAPMGLLGVGVGARSVIGSGVWIAPGRSVGPDQCVMAGSERVLLKPEPLNKGSFTIHEGGLKPT